jgi:hypothetical protein
VILFSHAFGACTGKLGAYLLNFHNRGILTFLCTLDVTFILKKTGAILEYGFIIPQTLLVLCSFANAQLAKRKKM